jgi:hypothetical protein
MKFLRSAYALFLKNKAYAAVLTLSIISSPSIQAATVQVVGTVAMALPEFNGDLHFASDPYPLAAVSVGTFNVPSTITDVTISGTFGNSQGPASAGVDLYLDSILVGQCVKNDPCWTTGSVAWNYTFNSSDLGIFADGAVELIAIQTSEYSIRLGITELQYSIVPLPSAAWLMISGLLGLIGTKYRKTASAA